MNARFDESEVRRALSLLVAPASIFEIRALDAQLRGHYRKSIVSGYFDNANACIAELKKLTTAKGIYFTLNPVYRALLARCANRLDYAEKYATTNDQHIVQRRRLLIDVDYDRPAGISATAAEKAAAAKKTTEIYRFLKERGFPMPVVGDSGNGHHLLYRVELPSDDGKLLERVLCALADHFDGDGVKIDRSVHNPARIVRLYGTLAAKGDNTKERPHRFSKILKAPESLEAVSAEQLRALVDELQPAPPPKVAQPAAHSGGFDVDAFLARHGVPVAERITQSNGAIKWRLEHCPFNPDHETPDAAVFQMPGGKLGFKCLHTSCVEKHWQDFRRHFEPDYDKASTDKSEEKPARPWKSAATQLVELADKFAFFHDGQDRPFVRLEIDDHTEVWPVESTKFRKLLAKIFYKNTKRAINRNAVGDAITTLAGIACHDGEEEPVYLRVAPHGENILIDLCDEAWRVVEVTPGGWRILSKSPVAFFRTGSMQSLPVPVGKGGSIAPLWKLLNVTEAQRPLVAGSLLNGFHPDGPYFVTNYVGEQGSAKSCGARMHRQIIDPNENPLRSPPKEERDLLVQAACNRCVALDNLSSLPAWLSDSICRLATGGGHSARELYTDLEEISIAVKRPVILNGIGDVATRPDLAERCLQIELETIPNEERILEKDLWPEFDRQWPTIFSGILDALVCALRELPKIKLASLPRMADAALFATAGETAFGWERGTFIKAYTRNLDESAVASVEANPVGVAILALLEKETEWTGTAAELLETLGTPLTEEARRARNWPWNPRALSNTLRRLAPALRRAGIDYQRLPRKADRRLIFLAKKRKVGKTSSQASSSSFTEEKPDPSGSSSDGYTSSSETTSSSFATEGNDVCDDPDDLSPTFHFSSSGLDGTPDTVDSGADPQPGEEPPPATKLEL